MSDYYAPMQCPPLHHWQQYPATTGISGAAILISLACWTWLGFDPFLMDDRAWHGDPWRLVVSALPHVNLLHLLFNLSWMWVFGTIIEGILGWRMLIALSLLTAATSAAAEYAIFNGGVGLSGIVYGLFGFLWVLSKRDPRFAGFISQLTVQLFLGWFLLCCVLTAARIWRVGNVAHGAGAAFGVLAGLWLTRPHSRRWIPSVGLLVATALVFAGATVGRPYVNLGTPTESERDRFAYRDLKANRNEAAVAKYQLALQNEPTRADYWFNLGIALHRLNRNDEGVAAYQQAFKLNSSDEHYKEIAADTTGRLAFERQVTGDHKEAARLYRQALEIDDRSAPHWFNLGVACVRLEDIEGARDAFQRALALDNKNAAYQAALDALPIHFEVN